MVLLSLSWKAEAQVAVSIDIFERISFSVETQVVDSVSDGPVSFASVYLIPKKDTLITNFTLTDTLGKATLTKVVRGEYDLCVEYLGYEPYVKSIFVRNDRELPAIRLKPSHEYLKAAKISAVGEAVEYIGDTIIYNAVSFRPLAGDNLADLLKKMPGIEVDESGGVKVNGRKVSGITVNGKAFFTGDNRAVLDNLPATFVNKVKVKDKENEMANFSGLKTSTTKETEMDVELKEEYKKGLFGNLKVSGGSSVRGKNDNEFIAGMPFLYDASTMLSAYGEKNQLTTLANARNVVGEDVVYFASSGGMGDNLGLGMGGLHSSWSAGTNLNTEVIKGLETNVSLLYNRDQVNQKSRSDRVTFMEGDDLVDAQESSGGGAVDNASLKFEIRNKNKKKFLIHFAPSFVYKTLNESSSSVSSSMMGEEEKNHSLSQSSSSMEQYSAEGRLNLGHGGLGKAGRSLYSYSYYNIQNTYGFSSDRNSVWLGSSALPSERDLLYDKDLSFYNLISSLNYVEPLGGTWIMSMNLKAVYSSKKDVAAAFNEDGTENEYYTSDVNNRYTTLGGTLKAQYSGNNFTLSFGTDVDFIENYNKTKSYGVNSETGSGEWLRNISPSVSLNWAKDGISCSLNFSGISSQPSPSYRIPTFSLVDPTRLSLGNIYLKPSFDNTLGLSVSGNVKNIKLMLWTSGRMSDQSIVTATWFDENSIRYSIPVNSLSPRYSWNANGEIYSPLNKEKTLSISFSPYLNLTRSTGYQAKGVLTGIDVSKFSYSEFMGSFWGDADGSRFYTGQSGFMESVTQQFTFNGNLRLNMNLEKFLMIVSLSSMNIRASYSLDSRSNTSSWNHQINVHPQYTAPYDVDISADMSYIMRRGYGPGYDRDYLNLKIKIQKSFKAFALALIGSDLLNDAADGHRRVVADNYVQNSYDMVMGRHILLRLTWNFGKMNVSKGHAAQRASLKLQR